MSKRTYTIFTTFVGLICGFVIIRHLLFADSLTLRNALVSGLFTGFGLAVVTVEILARFKATKVNGWTTIYGCGVPGNGMFFRAVCSKIFPCPVNIPEEAMYWWAHVDGADYTLSGERDYVLHFPPGGLPPNDAFWSLTMADAKNRFVVNPINRHSVGDRSGLMPNADGSIDIYIQNAVPAGHAPNWLPAPTDTFNIWLRVYMPGEAILDGKYSVPPIVEVKLKQ